MKMAEVRKLTGEEIDVEVDRLQRKLFDLRTQTVTEKIEDPSQFRKIRKDIARLKTERTSRFRVQREAAVAQAVTASDASTADGGQAS